MGKVRVVYSLRQKGDIRLRNSGTFVVKEIDSKTQKLIEEVSFAEKLEKPYQLSISAGGLRRLIYSKIDTIDGSKVTSPTAMQELAWEPILTDFAWYPSKSFGLMLSGYFSYGSFLSFGSDDTATDGELTSHKYTATENSVFLGGIGFSYRTLGRVSGEFALAYYAGAASIRAKESFQSYYDEGNGFTKGYSLEKGERDTLFYHIFAIRPSLTYYLSSSFALKTGVDFYIAPHVFTGKMHITFHPHGFNQIHLTFFRLGLAYIW